MPNYFQIGPVFFDKKIFKRFKGGGGNIESKVI